MSQTPPKCEHCGYEFSTAGNLYELMICPACGLTAHPLEQSKEEQTETVKVSSSRGTKAYRTGMTVLALLALCLLAVDVLQMRRMAANMSALFELLSEMELHTQFVRHALEKGVLYDELEHRVEPAAPSVSAEELAAATAESTRRQVLHDEFRARLEQRVPMYRQGDFIRVRYANGLIERGTLAAIRDDAIDLEQNGEMQTILLEKLDADSRGRLDAVFREQAIEQQVSAMLNQETSVTQTVESVP